MINNEIWLVLFSFYGGWLGSRAIKGNKII